MNTIPPPIQDLARRLIALEAASGPPDGPVGTTVRVCEKLRVPLAKLVGVAGFRSLLSRALAMAKVEVPSLDSASVRPDGTLEGMDGAGQPQDSTAGAVVVARQLELLVTFIGEPLTLGLVRDAWPEPLVDATDWSGEVPS